MSDTIILQQQRDARCNGTGNDSHRWCHCEARDLAPQWDYVAPTSEMDQKGLSADCLQLIVQEINKESLECFERNYKYPKPYKVFIPYLVALVIVGYFVPHIIAPCIFAGFCVLGLYASVVSQRANEAKPVALGNLKQYVDQQLNPQWNRVNIQWQIKEVTVTYRGRKTPIEVKYHDVEIALMTGTNKNGDQESERIGTVSNQEEGLPMYSEYALTSIEGVQIPESSSVYR